MRQMMFWWDSDVKKYPFYFRIISEYGFHKPSYSDHMFRPYNLNIFKCSDRSQYVFRLYWRGRLRDGGIK